MLNDSLNSNKQKDSQQNRDFYVTSVLKYNVLTELCQEISNTEALDINVEKFLSEIADNYVDSVLSTACTLAKHRGSDSLTANDVSVATGILIFKFRKKFRNIRAKQINSTFWKIKI